MSGGVVAHPHLAEAGDLDLHVRGDGAIHRHHLGVALGVQRFAEGLDEPLGVPRSVGHVVVEVHRSQGVAHLVDQSIPQTVSRIQNFGGQGYNAESNLKFVRINSKFSLFRSLYPHLNSNSV